MVINSIKLVNFRCFDSQTVVFSDKTNIICGANATGKTSVLEGIYCLSLIKSYRCCEQNELINDQNKYFYLEGNVKKENSIEKISLYGDNRGRKVKINNFEYKKLSEFIGYFNVVCFSALDFLLLKGSSKERRKLFDLVICQISKDYLILNNNYKKVLKERNTLLKRLIFENTTHLQMLFDVLTKQLVELGIKIIEKRKEIVKKISSYANNEHAKITDLKECLEIVYQPSVSASEFERQMVLSKEEDLKKGYTNYGPHRDDYIFIINNKNTAIYGSGGQQRNALLSTKLGMAILLYEYKKDPPVLLLDDVFSELDENRQNAIVRCLNKDFQTIITAATITDLNEQIVNDSKIINIERSA